MNNISTSRSGLIYKGMQALIDEMEGNNKSALVLADFISHMPGISAAKGGTITLWDILLDFKDAIEIIEINLKENE